MLGKLNQKQNSPTKIYSDNNSAIALKKKRVFHRKRKYIDIKYYCIHDLVKDKEIELKFCKPENEVADILTKPLKCEEFYKLKKNVGNALS